VELLLRHMKQEIPSAAEATSMDRYFQEDRAGQQSFKLDFISHVI
jgi:hypothetical protein